MDIAKINDLLIEVSSENTKLHLKNEQLENNWNELKEYFNPDKWDEKYLLIETFYNKMQEIESGNNECI